MAIKDAIPFEQIFDEAVFGTKYGSLHQFHQMFLKK